MLLELPGELVPTEARSALAWQPLRQAGHNCAATNSTFPQRDDAAAFPSDH
jgi:hypothetical protein